MADKFNKVTRRDFIKSSVLASAALSVDPQTLIKTAGSYDAKGIPTRTLGKTGVRVPIMVFGTGSRFMSAERDTGLKLLEYALENGLYYWDTAASYKNDNEFSEERLGQVLKDQHTRKRVFLATKVHERDAEEAKKVIEESFKRLQTDYIDLLQIHSINSMEDAQNLQPVVDILKDYKKQGAVRFIGFTGHTSAEAMAHVASNYDLDTMLIALNHMKEGENFEGKAVPAATKKNMGVIGMKVIRPRETVESLAPESLIKYALSLKTLSAANVGMDSFEVMKQNIALLKQFEPLPQPEMERLRGALEPFYQNENLPWLQPGYVDGVV
ncbi:MAG: aldo/keto reductase [Candidatus Cyclobacteriaceae bacterium M3_2C_046]